MPDNHRKFVAIVFVALCMAACGGRPEATEQSGDAPPATADAATQVGLSTSGQAGTMLNAPGNYMRGMAGNIDRAKKAAGLAGKTAADRMSVDPEKDAGN